MTRLAHLLDAAVPKWRRCDFSDRIRAVEPEFADLRAGDLVATLEPLAGPLSFRPSEFRREWVIRRVFRVTKSEETGDALTYDLDLACLVSSDEPGRTFKTSSDELMREHNWFPDPGPFFEPFPTVVWNWLRETKGVPLPPVGVPE